MQHLQTDNPVRPFDVWLEDLAKITAEQTGMTIEKARSIIRIADARTWYQDGFSALATFRETYSNENDCE